jgi:hypothetical protein
METREISSTSTFRHRRNLLLIFFGGLCLFAFLLLLTHRLPQSDDFYFQEQIKPYATVWDWLVYRYHAWSGRFFAEAFVYIFSPLPLMFWRSISLFAYALFTGFIFLYYRLFTSTRSHRKDYFMLLLAFTLPFLMDTHVLSDGTFWVTGAMNYFWLVVFALVAYYPFCYFAVRKKLPHWTLCLISLLSTIVAASSQEQIGAILVTLSVVSVTYFSSKHVVYKDSLLFLRCSTLIATLFFIFSTSAPGNHVRVATEAAKRIPDFYTIPLLSHIEYAYRWFLDSTINHSGLLLILFWLSILVLFTYQRRSARLTSLETAIMTILSLSLVFVSLNGFSGIGYWFNFYPTWNVHPPHISYIVLVPWTLSLAATIVAPIVLFRHKVLGLVMSLLCGAFFASEVLITLSPTMYASGVRVLYVPSIVLVLAIYLLVSRVYDKNERISVYALVVLSCLALSQYILLLNQMLH